MGRTKPYAALNCISPAQLSWPWWAEPTQLTPALPLALPPSPFVLPPSPFSQPLCIIHITSHRQLGSSNIIIMASVSSLATSDYPSFPNHPTTPIKRNSCSLYRFGGNSLYSGELYARLAVEMSPYFVGPMPVGDFLSDFLPPPVLSCTTIHKRHVPICGLIKRGRDQVL